MVDWATWRPNWWQPGMPWEGDQPGGLNSTLPPPSLNSALPPPSLSGTQNSSAGLLDQAANPDASIWEVDPFQAFLNQLGIGATGLTPYQKWQKAQFYPTYGGYLASSQLNPPAAGGVAGTFGDYLSQTGIQGARQTAPSLFSQIGSLSPETQRGFWENLGAFANDLLKNVLGQRYGAPIAAQMAQTFPAVESAFLGGPGYADPESSFLDYLRSKYNL